MSNAMAQPTEPVSQSVEETKKGKKTQMHKHKKTTSAKKTAVKTQSLSAVILAMMARKNGASRMEIKQATVSPTRKDGWEDKSIRGFVSTLKTVKGIDVTAWDGKDGIRRWKISK